MRMVCAPEHNYVWWPVNEADSKDKGRHVGENDTAKGHLYLFQNLKINH
jgi:hypothetical protein